jgi:hypothetical protein
MSKNILDRISDGRTDLVFDYVSAGHAANSTDANGMSLIQVCAYYGDVSGIRFLLAHGASLKSLGENMDLNGSAFHGHWRLCQFLIENGADGNRPLTDTGETPLHAALCKTDSHPHARSGSCLPREQIPIAWPTHLWKRVVSCATAEQKAKPLSIALPPSAQKSPSNCYWMKGQPKTPKT